ncbi:MAG: NirD/YgiW/YdeI family stress tolerance protein [Deltaproteobacteria bacterium]|nr:NirD/YgiW/YdeI family stress tolerance protein [Deltaproteobacteria bacterium]
MRFTKGITAVFHALALCALPSAALSAYVGGSQSLPPQMWPASLIEPAVARVTVEQARYAKAGTPVVVKGSIAQHVGSDQYVFEDETSSILVSIPDQTWRGQDIAPTNVVELHGTLKKTPRLVKINVAKIVKVQ